MFTWSKRFLFDHKKHPLTLSADMQERCGDEAVDVGVDVGVGQSRCSRCDFAV